MAINWGIGAAINASFCTNIHQAQDKSQCVFA